MASIAQSGDGLTKGCVELGYRGGSSHPVQLILGNEAGCASTPGVMNRGSGGPVDCSNARWGGRHREVNWQSALQPESLVNRGVRDGGQGSVS